MKKIPLILLALVVLIGLSSCLDAFQHVTVSRDGDIEISLMITISKSLFNLGGGGGGGESLEETFKSDIADPDELSAMLPGAKQVDARLIDSDVDYGYMFKFTVPRDYRPDPTTGLAPSMKKDQMEILLTLPGNSKGDESGDEFTENMDEMGEAIFSSAKYKVEISKKLLPYSSRAYIQEIDGSVVSLDLVDLGDSYLVNLPMLSVMMGEESRLIFEY